MKKNFKAVLFDLDGTLADTMDDNFKAWRNAFEKYNVNIKKEDYFPLEGMNVFEIARVISNKYNINSNHEKIVRLKNDYYLKNHKFRFYSGAEELINSLKKKKLLALVSASPREKLEKTVPETFLRNFKNVISGDDVENGKPNPEPYLKAMDVLSLKPEECTVIENAPLGIQSAKAAGIYCIAITNTLPKKELRLADKIVFNFKELEKLLLDKK